ncbi:VTT domain-containing protein [Patescibacteria group bacterium]
MKSKKLYFWETLFVVLIIALSVWLGPMVDSGDFFQKAAMKYGYLGTFVVSIVSGFNLIVPVPAVAFFPVLVSVGLNKWFLILIISLGVTIADSGAFFVGKYGRKLVKEGTLNRIEKLNELYEKHHWMPLTFLLLFASVAPLPNELLVVPLSFLGFKLKSILPVVFFGNLIFNSAVGLGLVSISGII